MAENIDNILVEYLETCNEVVRRHIDSQHPNTAEMAGRILKGQIIKLVIYEENLDEPCCFAHISYRSGRFEKVPPSAGQPRISWTLSRRSLEEIVEQRREITERSKKLGWGCLASRLGIKFDDEILTDLELS